MKLTIVLATAVLPLYALSVSAQSQPATSSAPQTASAQKPAAAAAAVTPPADYVIGPGDVLTVNVWRDKDMTGDYIVRPDGKITMPLLGDVDAVGLTPVQLGERLKEPLSKLLVDPSITVAAKEINSRRVFINGGVQKPGAYGLLAPTTVTQLLSMAGGLREYVDSKKIRIQRYEGGKLVSLPFNYKELLEGKNLGQDIPLRPGDTVLVPEPD